MRRRFVGLAVGQRPVVAQEVHRLRDGFEGEDGHPDEPLQRQAVRGDVSKIRHQHDIAYA